MNFKDLIAYQKAKELKTQCVLLNIRHSAVLPRYYQDQLGRAALSVILNIAEGTGRETIKDKSISLLWRMDLSEKFKL
jgi:four helix bundle protein